MAGKDQKRLYHSLLIPAIPPSSYSLCRIVQIMYALEVKLSVPKVHKTDKLRVPITIGTVPLSASNIYNMHAFFSLTEHTEFINSGGQALPGQLPLPPAALEALEENATEMMPVRPPAYSDIPPLAEEIANYPSKSIFSQVSSEISSQISSSSSPKISCKTSS